MHGLSKFRWAVRWIRNRFTGGAHILLYHRVTELPSDPQLLCVTRQHFDEHLEVLRKYYHPMPLQQLVQGLRDGNVPSRAAVITFDDGYADNLYHAKPLLERHDIPATIFVTSGYVGSHREFWWDELERLVLEPRTLPQILCLRIDGKICRWDLGEAAHYSEEAYRHHGHWNVELTENPSPRQSLYRSLCELLRPLPKHKRCGVLDDVLAWAGAKPVSRATHHTLSADEAFRLAEGNFIEVGAHTVTHPVLSKLPVDAQRAEIEQSKTCLEEIVGRPVNSFAYPFGSRSDYTAWTVGIVRDAGFKCACSNFPGFVSHDIDHFQLPRWLVRDWDGEEFLDRIQGRICE